MLSLKSGWLTTTPSRVSPYDRHSIKSTLILSLTLEADFSTKVLCRTTYPFNIHGRRLLAVAIKRYNYNICVVKDYIPSNLSYKPQIPKLKCFSPVLQLSFPNPLKLGVKSKMKMQLEHRRQAMLQLHLSDQQSYCLLRCDLYQRFDMVLDNGFVNRSIYCWFVPFSRLRKEAVVYNSTVPCLLPISLDQCSRHCLRCWPLHWDIHEEHW